MREDDSVHDGLKRDLGAEAFNAQYLQAPVPAGGNMLRGPSGGRIDVDSGS